MEHQSGLLPTPAGYTGFPASSPTQPSSPSADTSRSLYIGNLHPKITEPLLYEIFSTIGTVATCKIIRDKNGVSSGYGFIDYYDHPTANLAITHLNGRRVYGQEIKINWAHATGQKEDTTNHFHIFVGDLSPEIDDQALQNAFSAFGSISDARVMWDQNTGKSRGYGFVSFRQKADAEQALADMNGEWLGSRAIRCNWANQKVSSGASDSGPMDFTSVLSSTSPNNTTVYVGNLSADVNEHVLRSVFLEYGYIDEIRIQNSNPDKAFGFIKFATHDSAAKAIVHVNGKPIGSKMVKCSWGKEKGAESSATTAPAPVPSPMVQPTLMATTPNYGYPQPYVYPQAYPPTAYYGAQPMYYPPGYYYPNNNTK